MLIDYSPNRIEIIDEPTYTFGSVDNVRAYPIEMKLDHDSRPTSIHGVWVDGEPMVILSDGGGCSCVHDHSGLVQNDLLFLAVGRHIACISLHPFKFLWALKTDGATCFGVHYDSRHDALISHGELQVARFSSSGVLQWEASGADIFSDGFNLGPAFVEVTDFEQRKYLFNYEDGRLVRPF